jgi:hypothetical protein
VTRADDIVGTHNAGGHPVAQAEAGQSCQPLPNQPSGRLGDRVRGCGRSGGDAVGFGDHDDGPLGELPQRGGGVATDAGLEARDRLRTGLNPDAK